MREYIQSEVVWVDTRTSALSCCAGMTTRKSIRTSAVRGKGYNDMAEDFDDAPYEVLW
jgi:hypothetical protein